MTVRDRIREQPLPGESEAAARSWPVVEAALAERAPAARPRRLVLRLALVAALLCVGLVAALTPAGAGVGDWIGDRFADRAERAAPAFAGLPPGRSVLAISGSGAYAVHADGDWRRLGAFSDAGWSPRGLHVVGVDGHRLVAVTAGGHAEVVRGAARVACTTPPGAPATGSSSRGWSAARCGRSTDAGSASAAAPRRGLP